MPRKHPCIRHIDHCPAVIRAGRERAERIRLDVERAEAERIRREVEQAEAARLKQAVDTQALTSETLAQMITRGESEASRARYLARGGSRIPSPRTLLRGVEEVPTYYELEEVEDVVAP